MKAKIVILTMLLAVMLLWVFQSASAQDNETTENTEKVKELNQQGKQSPLAKIWDYISNNALLAGVIAIVVVALGTWVIQRLRRRQERQKPSLPVVQPPSEPLPTGFPEIAREALEKGRGLTIETEKAKMTISPAIDGISELMPKETPVRQHIEDGDRFFHKDEFKESASSYDKARKTARDLKDEKSSALAYLGKGAALCRQGKYNEAITILTECTNYLEGEALARTHFNRAVAYYELKDYKEALSGWDKAIEINPQYAEAYNNRGAIYDALKEYQKAIEDCNKAIEINPQYAEAYNNRGVAYAELKDYKKAIEDFDKAIEINPQFAEAYCNRGAAYGKLKDYKRAIEDYDKAIEINPQYAVAYYNRGVGYYGLKDYKKAIEDFDKAVEINPQYAKAYYNRGVAYDELKDYKKAIEDYDKAIEIDPQFAEAYNNRGVAYDELKDYKKAIEDYNEAINLKDKLPDKGAQVYNNRGNAYGKLKDYKRAIEDYDEAIEINPQNATPYYNLACVYALKKQEGDKERMINYLKKAIELDDESKSAKEDEDFKDYWDDPEFKKLVE